MRVSLAPARPALPVLPFPAHAAMPLCDPAGARVVLGGKAGPDGLAEPIVPGASTLFGPRGAALAAPGGPLFACDTGHHRLLVWSKTPQTDHAPADFLIGQPSFAHEGRNAKGEVGAATLNVPTGIAAMDDVLVVADAWNHRVLIWHGFPARANQPADVVLGQKDFAGGLANRGADHCRADTLNWCYGVAILGGRLFVADTGNRRLLGWGGIPQRNGTPADLVLGQNDFTTRDENAGEGGGALGMRWPHSIVEHLGQLLVSDAGNNRIMGWNVMPRANGTPCDMVLGQSLLSGQDHNQAAYWPTSQSLNMPYGLALFGRRLVAADTANSRLLGWDADAIATNAPALWLAGQHGFTDKGDNRWGGPRRDSVCWPYGLDACGETLVVADSGNNRILLWEAE